MGGGADRYWSLVRLLRVVGRRPWSSPAMNHLGEGGQVKRTESQREGHESRESEGIEGKEVERRIGRV